MTTPWPLRIARSAIVEFSAYAARGGATQALHLDANEAPWAPPPVQGVEGYNRYPEQQPQALMARLAGLYGVPAQMLMLGRGADEAIEVLLRTFCEAGEDSVLICPPTFGYYETSARIQGAKIVTAPLNDDFSYNKERILAGVKSAQDSLKLVFLCSPNNPTGNSIAPDIVEDLCQEFPEILVIVDEAYAEFSDAPSFIEMQDKYANLVVLRTLSKAYALAGVRVGVAIADPRIIELMCKVLPPYPIPKPVEDVVMRALSPSAIGVHEARLIVWKSERIRMGKALEGSGFVTKIYPSDANFLLLEIADKDSLMRALAKRQIRVREYPKVLPNAIRISIGTPQENDIALAAFGVATGERPAQRIGEAHRKTKETDIAVRVNLDDALATKISTGIGFYDHMLEALAKHGDFGLVLSCAGDLHIDGHHTIEDCALALGTALKQALGNKQGIGRFGVNIPMDESQAQVAIDLSGRPAMVFEGDLGTEPVGDFAPQMCPHFFESLSQTLGAAIHITVSGDNTHHMIEACFKGVGRALAPAFKREGNSVPSTKGVL